MRVNLKQFPGSHPARNLPRNHSLSIKKPLGWANPFQGVPKGADYLYEQLAGILAARVKRATVDKAPQVCGMYGDHPVVVERSQTKNQQITQHVGGCGTALLSYLRDPGSQKAPEAAPDTQPRPCGAERRSRRR